MLKNTWKTFQIMLLSLSVRRSLYEKCSPKVAKRVERVLTTDPGMGVVRHVDAGYDEAIEFAEKNDVKIPMKKQ